MKKIVLIPAYEPDEKLIKLVNKIDGNNYDIVVVDDGSKNKELIKSAKNKVHLISYNKNMGKGYALKQGLKYIKDKYKNYIVVTMDADGQHDFDDASNLCDYVIKHNDTLVIGRRYWDKKTPIKNRMGNAITRFVFNKKTGLKIYDTQSGLRAFSYKLTDYMLGAKGNRYEYEMNVLLNLKKNHIKYYEMDIKTIYFDKDKKSHFKSVKDSYRIYKEIIKHK